MGWDGVAVSKPRLVCPSAHGSASMARPGGEQHADTTQVGTISNATPATPALLPSWSHPLLRGVPPLMPGSRRGALG
jgi:hypothetical protein